MEKAYAQALWDIIEKGKKPKEAVRALHDNLQLHGRANLMPRIAKEFARIAERARKVSGMTLYVARERDERTAHREAKEILAKLEVSPKEVSTKIDETLIGGWRLEGRGEVVDASFKKHLLEMYNRATQ